MTKVPLKNAVVKIYDMTGKLVASGYTDESGRFITELLGGKYNITVEKSGYMPHEQTIDLISDKVKEVVLEKIKPYSIITHPVAVIGDRLGLTQTIPVTVVRTYPKTVIGDRLEHQAISLYPSGFDPNDPRWMPEGGWDKIIDFTSPEDLNELTSNDEACFGVENGLLKIIMETAPDVLSYTSPCYSIPGWLYCEIGKTEENKYIKALATALKVVSRKSDANGLIFMTRSCDGNECVGIIAEYSTSEKGNCCISDPSTGNNVQFNCLSKWILIKFDYELKTVKVYIEGVEEPITLTLGTKTLNYLAWYVGFFDSRDPDTYELLADIFVDWIAIKYA